MNRLSKSDEWFDARELLNHDVLINKVLNAFDPRGSETRNVEPLVPYLQLFVAREVDFRTLVREALKVLQPGTWLAAWMGSSLDTNAAETLGEFLNMDFVRTSQLPKKFQEIESLLDQALKETRWVLKSQSTGPNDDTVRVQIAIQELSDALTALPKTMLDVVESMR